MAEKKVFRKIGSFILDILEIYIPLVSFLTMFVVFVLQIFFRYVLNRPLTWPYEITLFGFIWTAVLGACYAKRHSAHVVFGLVYDKLSPKLQLLFRLVGNGLIFIAFCIAIYPSYLYIQFMSYQKSTVVRIPFNIAYFPFVVFMLLIIGRTLNELIVDFRKFFKREA